MNKKSKIIKVPAQNLRLHPTAQRDLVRPKLKKLTDEMDLDAIGVLHAVEYEINRELATWIIDGHHRWHALMDLGLGEWIVEVKVHLDVTDDARASDLFLKLNDRSMIRPFARFTNEVHAKSACALDLVRITKDRGLTIADHIGDSTLCCIASLKTLYTLDSGHSLALALDVIVGAWGRSTSAMEGKIIEGLGIVIHTYGSSIDTPVLIKKLAKHPGGASGMLGDAKGLRQFRKTSLSRCFAETLVEVYNTGRKTGKLDPL